MRRTGIITIIALLLVALVGTSVAARPDASFVGRAGVGEQGGSMLVKAKVKHAAKRAPFSARAEVFFGGLEALPTSLDLKRRGRSFVASSRVAVPADQAVGPVEVHIFVTYGVGGVETMLPAVFGEVVAPEAP